MSERYVWPPLEFRCPGCARIASFSALGHDRRRRLRSLRCKACGETVIVQPIARVEVSRDGVPFTSPLGFVAIVDRT